MMIEITQMVENPDGSADVQLSLDSDALKLIVQEGFVFLLRSAIQAAKSEVKQCDDE